MAVIKVHKQRQSRTLTHHKVPSKNKLGIFQHVRNQGRETRFGKSEFKTYYFGGIPWDACTYREITIPPYKKPYWGTGTSGNAPWAGVLLDNGYSFDRNATRLHVINSNFGGRGGNNEGNLHPGSQLLNKRHLDYAEDRFKRLLNNPMHNNRFLKYNCRFEWTLPHSGKHIPDPTTLVQISSEDDAGLTYKYLNIEVPKGNGMIATANFDRANISDGDEKLRNSKFR